MSHSKYVSLWKDTAQHPFVVERTFSPKTKETLPCAGLLLYVHKSKHEKASTVIGTGFQAGDPREIRTPDTLIRSQVLYPAELLGHVAGAEGLKPPTYGFGDRCSINCAMPLSVWWKSSSMWLVYNNKSFRKLQGVFANIFEKRFWCKVQGPQKKGATGPVKSMGWCGA